MTTHTHTSHSSHTGHKKRPVDKDTGEELSGMGGAEFVKKLAATGTGQQKLEICRQVLRDRGEEATAEDCLKALEADPMVTQFTLTKARGIVRYGDWKPDEQALPELPIEDQLLLRRRELDQRRGSFRPGDAGGLTTDRRSREIIGDRERAMATERDLEDYNELAEAEAEETAELDPVFKKERDEEQARLQDREREVRLANIREMQRQNEATAGPGSAETNLTEEDAKPQFRAEHPKGVASPPPRLTEANRPNPGNVPNPGGPATKPDDATTKPDEKERPANAPKPAQPQKPEDDPKKAHETHTKK